RAFQALQLIRSASFIERVKSISSVRHICNFNVARMIRNAIVRSSNRDNDRAHVFVYVAKQVADAELIEALGPRCARLVQPQIEALTVVKGKYVVEERILVWKSDGRTDLHNR